MRPEHTGIIEAMADAMFEQTEDGGPMEDEILAALRAAAERGYRLCKLPDPSPQPTVPYSVDPGAYDERRGWWQCFNAIETIELEESE